VDVTSIWFSFNRFLWVCLSEFPKRNLRNISYLYCKRVIINELLVSLIKNAKLFPWLNLSGTRTRLLCHHHASLMTTEITFRVRDKLRHRRIVIRLMKSYQTYLIQLSENQFLLNLTFWQNCCSQERCLCVNFTNTLRAVFCTKFFCAAFCVLTVWVCNFLSKGNRCKTCSEYVGNIDYLLSFEYQRYYNQSWQTSCLSSQVASATAVFLQIWNSLKCNL